MKCLDREPFPALVMLILSLMLGGFALANLGCQSFAAINASQLTAEQKATAKLFAVEETWVNAKVALADTLTELAGQGIRVPENVAKRMLQARDAGNRALVLARVALARRDSALLATAIAAIRTATTTLTRETAAAALSPEPGDPDS